MGTQHPIPDRRQDSPRNAPVSDAAYLPGESEAGEEDPGAALTLEPVAAPHPPRKPEVDASRKKT